MTMNGIVTDSDRGQIMKVNFLNSNPYIETLFASSRDGLLVVDQNAMVLLCNSVAENLMGLSASEVVGCPLQEIYDDDLLIRVLANSKEEEYCKRKLNGYTVNIMGYPIFDDGVVIGALGVFQDISETESILDQFDQQRKYTKELLGIIHNTHDGIVLTDKEGKILGISKGYCRISDVPWHILKNCIGTYCGELCKEAYVHGTKENSLLILNNNKSTTIKRMLWNRRELFLTGNPMIDENGNNTGKVVWNIRDITELESLRREVKDYQYQNALYYTELEGLRTRLLDMEGIVVHSRKMRKVVETAIRVATIDTTVLITGETGAGKEVIAKIIHKASPRHGGPFITINCGAIPETLLESEMFGYEDGAFTGAKKGGKIGLLEAANNGTVLLDEIGDLPLLLQVKLLRFIQDRQIFRVGSTKPIKLNVRLLAATNLDLKKMVKENKFREDLYYRLNVIPINLPPLRERIDDIIPLAQSFLTKFCKKYNMEKRFAEDVFDVLEMHAWPGNIRELENIIERALIISEDELVRGRHIQNYLENGDESNDIAQDGLSKPLSLKEEKELLEKRIISEAIDSGLSTRQVAKILKVDHSTIVRKLNKYKKLSSIK